MSPHKQLDGQKKLKLHEQHGYGGPPWVVHIFGPRVPKVIP
jgi:hypothetical protein